jgi:hypothetical protein
MRPLIEVSIYYGWVVTKDNRACVLALAPTLLAPGLELAKHGAAAKDFLDV